MEKGDAGQKVFPGTMSSLRPVWEALDDELIRVGLHRDVKTIYVSYTDEDRNLVAAVHPDPATKTIEVALSLPKDFESSLTYDATHLKWRTLPVAVRLKSLGDLTRMVHTLLADAIVHAPQSVARPSEEFARHRREAGTRFRS